MTLDNASWKLDVRLVPHLDDLHLVHVSGVTHDYPRHIHEEYCIAMILRGTETHFCRGLSYTAVPGDMLLLNAGEAHANRSVGVEYKSIQMSPRSFARLLSTASASKPTPFFVDPLVRDPETFQTFLNLYSTLHGDASPLEQESAFVSTIDVLVRDSDKDLPNVPVESNEPRFITRVRDHLREHYSENISLARLASIANLSPFHFVRVFNRQIGVPPHEYQTQLRITEAQRLMRRGRSISEAAVETGFFDQSHFTRNFKRITGMTPGTYLSHSNIVQDNWKRSVII